jgi:RNA polymerase sigma-70 factor (ECF subfamily)
MPDPSLSDQTLAEAFQRHRAGLAGAVRSIAGTGADPAAVVQEAFVRALEALRSGRGPHSGDGLLAWMFVLTMNLARDERRRRGRRPGSAPLDEAMEMADDRTTGAGPGTTLELREGYHAARRAIDALADPEKEVFLLRVSGGQTFEAAAQALGIPVGTAKTRMRAALARLRIALAEHAPEGGAR